MRAGLEAALRDAVRTGRLTAGLRLPSSRTLAADLGIARNTVAEAYGQLVAEGWLVARQGSGTHVASRGPEPEAPAVTAAPLTHPRYDLRPGSPDLSAFPRAAWLAAGRRALNAAPPEALGYADPSGRPELRQSLAGYLARARGLRVSAERIVICAGFTQALGLICHVLRSRGATTLAMEDHGLSEHRQIAAGSGLRLRSLPVDDHGALVEELGDADSALLTPAHQFPLGAVLAPDRRSQAIEWAAGTAGLIIEDDYDGEFRYDRHPVGAMQALAPEHVIYAGTASKSLAPGLRLGWLVLPTYLIGDIVAAKVLGDRGTNTLEQLTLAELIASGAYDRHVRRARLTYRRRRDRLLAALQRDAPRTKVTGIAAGLHALLELPVGQDEQEVISRAARRGLALEGLSAYRASVEDQRAGLVIGYGTPPEHAFTGAIARLTAALTDGP